MTWSDLVARLASVVSAIMNVVAGPVLIYFLVINTSLLVLMCLAGWEFQRHHRRKSYAGTEQAVASQLGQGVTVVVPCYNEEVVIVTAVQALLALRFSCHEVVVVDDGSTDTTFEQLRGAFDLVPLSREVPPDLANRGALIDVHVPRDGRTRLVLVRTENSGRSDTIHDVAANVALLTMFCPAASPVV